VVAVKLKKTLEWNDAPDDEQVEEEPPNPFAVLAKLKNH